MSKTKAHISEIAKIKHCAICGEEYHSRKRDSKYCSQKCLYIGRPKRTKIWIERKCKYCHKLFKGIPSEVKRGKSLFCSFDCFSKWRAEKRIVKCLICGKEFKRRNSTQRYCSRKCFNTALKRGEVHKYKTWVDAYGYKMKGMLGKSMPVHRLIVEKILGRKLKRKEIIHHINGNKQDNRNINLLVCSPSYHRYLHDRMSTLYMEAHFG